MDKERLRNILKGVGVPTEGTRRTQLQEQLIYSAEREFDLFLATVIREIPPTQ